MNARPFIKWFADTRIEDIPLVGGKNASLGEMVRELGGKGVKIPDGFSVTAEGYRHFIHEAELDPVIRAALTSLDTHDVALLAERGETIRRAVRHASLPYDLQKQIAAAYQKLMGGGGQPPTVAVRSSATAEDLPDASFAGQQETFLNITGIDALLDACKSCFASLFTDRAISYRVDKGFNHFAVALSVGVQHMVRSDLASSGVMFTIDTESGFRDAVLVSAAYGLGENVVQGFVTPDEYCIFKLTLKTGFRPILRKTLGSKALRMIYQEGGARTVGNVPVPPEESAKLAITDDEALRLARWACVIEDHYTAKRGHPVPMDLEWAKDGLTGELFIVQARPETVQSRKDLDVFETYHLDQRGQVLATGQSVGSKIATGRVRVIQNPSMIDRFEAGEILVTDKTDPDWQPIMNKAAAIVTRRGGRTCHAAIVSRELGVPAIVGVEQDADALMDGEMVTVSCAEGETGFVYQGALPFQVRQTSLKDLSRPVTKVMLNLANPEEAFSLSFLPNDGVGLARMEFIVSDHIKIHPLALVNFDTLADQEAKAEIARLTQGYDDKPAYFVDRLAQGVATLAAAFYPKDVILRLSDFKTNDLTQLILGVDRDSEIVAPLFDEQNLAVKTMIAQVIAVCRRKNRKIGICGQAPSDYPEFAEFLVEQGINSISLNPDTVLKTTLTIIDKERALATANKTSRQLATP